jgi:hypothetical protein
MALHPRFASVATVLLNGGKSGHVIGKTLSIALKSAAEVGSLYFFRLLEASEAR